MTIIEDPQTAAQDLRASLDEYDRVERGGRPPRNAEPPADRIGALWAGKWWIALSTIIIVLLTVGATKLVPDVYSSSGQVSVSASPISDAGAQDLVTAGNDLAAQYAQVITAGPVVAAAAKSSGDSVAQLISHTSSGTVASQNIIRITVQASTAAAAERDAAAMSKSLVSYIETQGKTQTTSYTAAIAKQLAPLDAQLSRAQRAVTAAQAQLSKAGAGRSLISVSAASATLTSAQSLLTTLTDRRAALASTASLQGLSLTPAAELLGGSSAASLTQPRPLLYALIAAILGFALSAQFVVVAAERRRRLGRSRVR